jgi:anti-sigma B factor antagonist
VHEALCSADVTGLELDLSHVSFLGAAGVRSRALAQRLARSSNRALHISCGSRRAVLRPLQLTGLPCTSTTGDRRA